MSRFITFSQKFPSYHPRKGQPTHFVEQFYNSLFSKNNLMDYPKGLEVDDRILGVKKHTIRKGNRWKVGDKFSPRVWSGKPYHSKHIILCKDIEIKKIWSFAADGGGYFYLNGEQLDVTSELQALIPLNDGLSSEDFLNWFPVNKAFEGQIICWDDNINYDL